VCQVHDPARVATVQAGRSRGGKVRALNGQRAKLDTVPALVKFTARLIGDLQAGSLDLNLGRALVYALTLQKGLVEISDIEARLAALETQYARQTQERLKRWQGA